MFTPRISELSSRPVHNFSFFLKNLFSPFQCLRILVVTAFVSLVFTSTAFGDHAVIKGKFSEGTKFNVATPTPPPLTCNEAAGVVPPQVAANRPTSDVLCCPQSSAVGAQNGGFEGHSCCLGVNTDTAAGGVCNPKQEFSCSCTGEFKQIYCNFRAENIENEYTATTEFKGISDCVNAEKGSCKSRDDSFIDNSDFNLKDLGLGDGYLWNNDSCCQEYSNPSSFYPNQLGIDNYNDGGRILISSGGAHFSSAESSYANSRFGSNDYGPYTKTYKKIGLCPPEFTVSCKGNSNTLSGPYNSGIAVLGYHQQHQYPVWGNKTDCNSSCSKTRIRYKLDGLKCVYSDGPTEVGCSEKGGPRLDNGKVKPNCSSLDTTIRNSSNQSASLADYCAVGGLINYMNNRDIVHGWLPGKKPNTKDPLLTPAIKYMDKCCKCGAGVPSCEGVGACQRQGVTCYYAAGATSMLPFTNPIAAGIDIANVIQLIAGATGNYPACFWASQVIGAAVGAAAAVASGVGVVNIDQFMAAGAMIALSSVTFTADVVAQLADSNCGSSQPPDWMSTLFGSSACVISKGLNIAGSLVQTVATSVGTVAGLGVTMVDQNCNTISYKNNNLPGYLQGISYENDLNDFSSGSGGGLIGKTCVLADPKTGDPTDTPAVCTNDATTVVSSVTCFKGASFWAWAPSPVALVLNDEAVMPSVVQGFFDSAEHKGFYAWRGSEAMPLVVFDPEKTGVIKNAEHLFGYATFGKKWEHGFKALASLDKNGDKKLSGEELRDLSLWFDKNQNAVSEAGEVRDLTASGITAIYFEDDQVDTDNGDIIVSKGYERVVDGNVRVGKSLDWFTATYASKEAAEKAIYSNQQSKAFDTIVSKAFASGVGPEGEKLEPKTFGATPLYGIWAWTVDNEFVSATSANTQGIFIILPASDGSVGGMSVIQTPTGKNKLGIASVAMRFPLYSVKYKEEGEKRSFSFNVDDTVNRLAIESAATLSPDGLSLTGTSTQPAARINVGDTPSPIRYTWSAKKITLSKGLVARLSEMAKEPKVKDKFLKQAPEMKQYVERLNNFKVAPYNGRFKKEEQVRPNIESGPSSSGDPMEESVPEEVEPEES